MFNCEREPLILLVEVTPRLAKKRYKESIYKAWNHQCGYCLKPATSLDHIIPKFSSGSSKRNNLLPACRDCNKNKGSIKMDKWYKEQLFFTLEQYNKIKEWMKEPIQIQDLTIDNKLVEKLEYA
jgi:5-methylcytosine-specific restriction endonuclease McrA